MNVSPNYPHLKGLVFIVPVHPPKYDYAYAMLQTVPPDVDVALVFTTEADRAAFKWENTSPNVFSLVMEHQVPDAATVMTLQKNAMPSFKKFFALSALQQKYEYMMCVDAEVRFLPGRAFRDIYHSVHTYYQERRFYAGLCLSGPDKLAVDIMRESARVSGRYEAMQTITDGFCAYFWFSDVPVYRFDDYAAFMNQPKPDLKTYMAAAQTLTWYTFEYILYAYFLIGERGWQIAMLPGQKWSLEHVNNYAYYQTLLNMNVRTSFTWAWCTVLDNPLPPDGLHPSIFMTYHHDRKSA